ncbi:hypothetical protein BN1708_007756 [Verticillium longisporum]|nr:hypothetical protein BN1708_007756 [Verticillium longisporum]
MFSLAQTPIFSTAFDATSNMPWTHSHRPSISSPLSSSPIRATSPASPTRRTTLDFSNRQTQSSPIQASSPKFKYASRQTKPNPAVRRREEAQESRRKLFLQNVRQRADERNYERRDMEGILLKSSWDKQMRELVLAKRLEGDAVFSEADIENAAELLMQEEAASEIQQPPESIDDMMVDEMAMQEQSELDALVMAYHEPTINQQAASTSSTDAHSMSDDEDYDAIFMDLVSQQDFSEQMDMS